MHQMQSDGDILQNSALTAKDSMPHSHSPAECKPNILTVLPFHCCQNELCPPSNDKAFNSSPHHSFWNKHFESITDFIFWLMQHPISRLVLVFDLELKCVTKRTNLSNDSAENICSFEQLKLHTHAIYSFCQAKCSQLDKLLLDVTVVYAPICGYSPIDFVRENEDFAFAPAASYFHMLCHESKQSDSSNFSLVSGYESSDDLLSFMHEKYFREPLEHNALKGCFSHDFVVLGGTFDHLHSGHKILLSAAALLSRGTVMVGIADDALLESKRLRSHLQSFDVRLHHIEEFFDTFRRSTPSAIGTNHSLDLRASDVAYNFIKITDVYGSTTEIPSIDCIIVSRESYSGAVQINVKRQALGLKALEVVVVDVLARDPTAPLVDFASPSKEFEDKVSSSMIREYIAAKDAFL